MGGENPVSLLLHRQSFQYLSLCFCCFCFMFVLQSVLTAVRFFIHNAMQTVIIFLLSFSIVFVDACESFFYSIRINRQLASVLQWSTFLPRLWQYGFYPRSEQANNYEIGICCFCARRPGLKRKNKDWLTLNQENVSEGATCLFEECCFSELSL